MAASLTRRAPLKAHRVRGGAGHPGRGAGKTERKQMLYAVADIFLSLLPARYRGRWQMNPVAGTIRSGILQAIIACLVYAALFFRCRSATTALYHITRGGEEQVGGRLRFRYCLKKSTEVGAYRGIVVYDPFEYWKSRQ